MWTKERLNVTWLKLYMHSKMELGIEIHFTLLRFALCLLNTQMLLKQALLLFLQFKSIVFCGRETAL